MGIIDIITGLVGLGTTIFPWILFLKNKKSNVSKALLFLSFMAGPLWAFSIVGYRISTSIDLSHIFLLTIYSVSIITAFATYWLTRAYPYKTNMRIWEIIIVFGIGFFLLYELYFTPNFVEELNINLSKAPELGWAYILWFIWFSMLLFWRTLEMRRTMLRLEDVEKRQARYIISGFTIAGIGVVPTNMILPFMGNFDLIWLGPIFIFCMVTLIAYGISTTRFIDFKYISNKVVRFIKLLSLPLLIFVIFNLISYIFFSKYSFLLLILSSTLFGSFLYYKTNKSKSDEINISEIFLKKASKSLNLNEIGNLLEQLLKENVYVKSFSYFIIQKDSKLKYSYKFKSDAQVINILTNQFWSYYKDPSKIILLAELKYLRTVSIETNNLWKYKRFITLIERMIENSWHIIVPISLSNNMKCLLFLGENSKNYMYSASEVSNIKNLTEVVRITIERGLLYKQTEDFNLSLQQKVSEQTKELQQKVQQLEEARRKEADMIDIMGHELRTPMSIVKLNTDLLHNFTDNVIRKKEDFIKYVTRIRNAVETEIVLINTLLSTAKLEGDKIDLNPTKVDIVEQIKMAMHSQETRAKRKGIQLITKFHPTAQNVYADHARTVEIVSNLIDNAVKYTSKGYVKVTTEDEGDFIRVSVIDTGMGISQEDLDRLGTKFFRTSNYTQSEFSDDIDIVRPGGSGLGLYVVFNLVEKMGGEIHVESQLGQGSNFTFALPKYRGQKPVSDEEYTKDMFERLGLKRKDDIKDNLQQ